MKLAIFGTAAIGNLVVYYAAKAEGATSVESLAVSLLCDLVIFVGGLVLLHKED